MRLQEFDPENPTKFTAGAADFNIAFFDLFESIADVEDLDVRFAKFGDINGYTPHGAIMTAVRRFPEHIHKDVMPGDYFIVARSDSHMMWRYTVEPGTIMGFTGTFNQNANFKIEVDPFGERVRTFRGAVFEEEAKFADEPDTLETDDVDLSDYFTRDRQEVDA